MAVATALLIGAAAFSAISAVQQGRAASKQAKFQAQVTDQQAARERQVAAGNEADFRRQQSRLQAQRRAALGASGVKATTGSPLLASGDFAAEVELAALRIREGGDIRATRLEQEAALTRRAGSNAQRAGLFRAGSSLLSGAGRAFG
jgi:hypothetical protein